MSGRGRVGERGGGERGRGKGRARRSEGSKAGRGGQMSQNRTACCCRHQGRPVLEGREGGKEGGRDESSTHSSCIASALPPSLPPFVPLPSNTTRGPCQRNAGRGEGRLGRANGTARMTLDVPNLVLLLGWSPLFLKQDGRVGRKKEDNDKREATHTRKRKRWVGGGGMAPSTKW